MKNNILEWREQKYLVDNLNITAIIFKDFSSYTKIIIDYENAKYKEGAFIVPYYQGKPDLEALSHLYISINQINRDLIK